MTASGSRRQPPDSCSEELLKLIRFDRLEEMMIEAGNSSSLTVVLLAPSRQRDQNRLLAVWQSPKTPRSLCTVHPWHPEIEKDNMRAECCCLRNAFLPIGRGQDLVS